MRDQLQYYPTGVRTAAKAWAKFRRPVRHLCDPSAGKGHLIRHAQEGFPGVPDDELPWVAEIEDTEFQEGRFRTRLRDYARMKFSNLKEVCIRPANPSTPNEQLQAPSCPRKPSCTP